MSSLSFPDRQQLIVTGYPRSGNTYTARLLGSIMSAPVTGAYNAKPLAQEGLDRGAPFVVRQLHLRPAYTCSGQIALQSSWNFCINHWTTERVIHVLRDPRDVTVSAHFYWQRTDLLDTIKRVAEGLNPFGGGGVWSTFVNGWYDVTPLDPHLIAFTRYESLLRDPLGELRRICNWLNLPVTDEIINNAITEQSFARKRKQVERDGETRPYGKAIQLRHMRKGISGDWRNHFDRDCRNLAFTYWQDDLIKYIYEHGDDWVK